MILKTHAKIYNNKIKKDSLSLKRLNNEFIQINNK